MAEHIEPETNSIDPETNSIDPEPDSPMSFTSPSGDVITWLPGPHMANHRQLAGRMGEMDAMTEALIAALEEFVADIENTLTMLCEAGGPEAEIIGATDALTIVAEVFNGAITFQPGPRIRWHLQQVLADNDNDFDAAALPVGLSNFANVTESTLCEVHQYNIKRAMFQDATHELSKEEFDEETRAFFEKEGHNGPPSA